MPRPLGVNVSVLLAGGGLELGHQVGGHPAAVFLPGCPVPGPTRGCRWCSGRPPGSIHVPGQRIRNCLACAAFRSISYPVPSSPKRTVPSAAARGPFTGCCQRTSVCSLGPEARGLTGTLSRTSRGENAPVSRGAAAAPGRGPGLSVRGGQALYVGRSPGPDQGGDPAAAFSATRPGWAVAARQTCTRGSLRPHLIRPAPRW
jgi:hypothetical protein